MYEIEFDEEAYKEWEALPTSAKEQFKKKLITLKSNPIIAKNRLSSPYVGYYKVKIKNYRLVYKIENDKLIIFVIIVGKRDTVYKKGKKRI